MTEQQLIEELSQNNFKGLKSTLFRSDKLFNFMRVHYPYPPLIIFRIVNGKCIEKVFTSEEHVNFRNALEYYKLSDTFDNPFQYQHSHSIESNYPGVLNAVLGELAPKFVGVVAFDPGQIGVGRRLLIPLLVEKTRASQGIAAARRAAKDREARDLREVA